MTKRSAARRARRKLRAHDKGLNRHHKVLSWMEKRARLSAERSGPKRKPVAVAEPGES